MYVVNYMAQDRTLRAAMGIRVPATENILHARDLKQFMIEEGFAKEPREDVLD